MRNIIISSCLLFTIACGNAENSETTDTTSTPDTSVAVTPTPAPTAPACDCYLAVLKRDTFVAALVNNNNDITGRLAFDNFEKDASSGKVHGTQTGDTIKLWYNFASEGMNSVMEVYFKKDGDNLVRGFGDVKTKGDSAYFSNKGNIKYDNKPVFEKVPCDSVLAKYRCDAN